MNNFFELKKIFIFSGILSIILTPLATSVNQEISALLENCTNWAGLPDNDCDGLANEWEEGSDPQYSKTVGVNTIVVHLPPAVDPDHRDILVEIDYMSHHIPPASAIDNVVNKFNDMEIENPDRTFGVNLHYIIDNDIIPHKDCINIFNDTDTDPTNDFDSIKKRWMGTAAEWGSNPDFYQAKRDVFHYMLFIHTRCDMPDRAGGAEIFGNDAFVSLGFPGWGNIKNGHDTGSDDYKEAAFMHELGHNLNLDHGGSYSLPDCKPNYISVMNYLFTFGYEPIDYSHNQIPPLDERALVEQNGIGPSDPVGLWTGTGHTIPPSSHPSAHFWIGRATPEPFNMNAYTGDWDPPFAPTLSTSINNFHGDPCNDNDVQNTPYNNRLWGFDDVHENILKFWGFSGPFANLTAPPIASGVGSISSDVRSPTLPDNLVASTKNNSILSISTKSLTQTTATSNDILKDPTLPPCSLSDPECRDSPCDEEGDPYCRLDVGTNFTNLTLGTIDYGNRPQNHRDLSAIEVLQAIRSKVLNINNYIQSTNASNFTNGTNVSTLKQDLQESLVNATDSAYSLINSSKSDEALSKILKLRSLVDGTHSSVQILQYPYNIPVLQLADNLILALEKRR